MNHSLSLSPLALRGVRDVHLYFALFVGSVAVFSLHRLVGPETGLIAAIMAVSASATCGWSWLLTRSLFRRAESKLNWPLAMVASIIGLNAALMGSGGGTASQMIGNLLSLICSTALLLALIEPLRGLSRDLPQGEQRFRIAFAAVYGTVLAVSFLWVRGAPEGSWANHWGEPIKVGCALIALAGAAVAVGYRGRHPLPPFQAQKPRRSVSDDDRVLGERILRLMTDEKLYTEPGLKVADLARRVGDADYRVTQCITGALGFRNFNQMVNHFRIECARQMLTDPNYDHLPVLTIALDCGFGSIGPFNRAFKAQLDATPTAFREQGRSVV